MKTHSIALMAVRKNSKGIPGRNIKSFAGKPLLFWAVESLLSTRKFDEISIATDCDITEQLIRNNFNSVVNVFRRSPASARDKAPIMEVIFEFLNTMDYSGDTVFMLAQATSPFTNPSEYEEGLSSLCSGDFDSSISCVKLKKYLWSPSGRPLNYDISLPQRRQEFDGFLAASGSFYVSTVGRIFQTGQLISGKTRVVEVNQYNRIDLDEEIDWIMGEALMRHLIGSGLYKKGHKKKFHLI